MEDKTKKMISSKKSNTTNLFINPFTHVQTMELLAEVENESVAAWRVVWEYQNAAGVI